MKAEWLCKMGGKECGPFSAEQLKQLADAGSLTADSEVRRTTDAQWVLARRVKGLIAPSTAAADEPTPPPIAVPVGQPVVQGVVAAEGPSATDGIPVGTPVVVTESAPPPAADFTLAPPTDEPNGVAEAAAVSGGLSRLLVYGVAGIGGVLAALAGFVLLVSLTSGTNQTVASGNSEPAAKTSSASPDAAMDAAPAGGSVNVTRTSANAAEGVRLDGFRDWKGPRTIQGFQPGARVQIRSIWLAADAAGKRIGLQLGSGDSSANSSSPGPVSTLQPAQPAQYLFVELEITNNSRLPVHYKAWNTPAAAAAVLLDETGAALELVPGSETPEIKRLDAVYLPADTVATDTLVFRAPEKSVQHYHLALPQGAIHKTAQGYFGWLVPPEKLFEKTDGEGAEETPAAAASDVPAPAASAETKKPRKARSQPETFEDLQRSINATAAPDEAAPREKKKK